MLQVFEVQLGVRPAGGSAPHIAVMVSRAAQGESPLYYLSQPPLVLLDSDEKLCARLKWLEADSEYQALMASTDEESDALINVHNREHDKIVSRLEELRPETLWEVRRQGTQLADLGVTKKRSLNWQKLAALDDAEGGREKVGNPTARRFF